RLAEAGGCGCEDQGVPVAEGVVQAPGEAERGDQPGAEHRCDELGRQDRRRHPSIVGRCWRTVTGVTEQTVQDPQAQRAAKLAVTVFPLLIIGGAVAAYLAPGAFQGWAAYVTPGLAIIMVGMGLTLTLPDFRPGA